MNTMIRTTKNRFRIAVLAMGLGAVAALAGCSSDTAAEPEEPASSQQAEEQAAESEAPAEEEPATEASSGSELSITIDGEPFEVSDPTVVCEEIGGVLTIAVGSMSGADGIGATLTTGDAPTVKTVALGSLDGSAMAWAEGAPGEASATKDGSTYTITGSMSAVDINDPTNLEETPFEMVIPCP